MNKSFSDLVYYKYSKRFICFFFILLIPILLINTYLNYIEKRFSNLELEAALWQEKTHGIACTGVSTTKKFKSLRIQQMISNKEANTAILGSSTVMGIRKHMFPEYQKVYNFSQNGIPFSIAELELLTQTKEISYYMVGIDIYNGLANNLFKGIEETNNLADFQGLKQNIDILLLMKDALSTSKVKLLFDKISTILASTDPKKNFLNTFASSPYMSSYQCNTGEIAKDFGNPYPGKCAGFRFDGSATFSNLAPLVELPENENLQRLLKMRLKYLPSIKNYGSDFSKKIFDRISNIIANVKRNNGEIMFILPALFPELEKTFLNSAEAHLILKVKKYLNKWAIENNVIILDASRSEEYGCKSSDFLDGIHAFSSCYDKVFTKFFQNKHKLKAGLVNASML